MDKIIDYISNAKCILITAHVSPDADAICSTLLLSNTLKTNFPDKKIEVNLEAEQLPQSFNFLAGFESISTFDFPGALEHLKSDLFILLDANNYSRCTRSDPDAIREYIRSNDVKTIIVDHHEQSDKEDCDLFIHRGSPAVTQDIYEICFEEEKLKKPEGYADTAMLGILGDTSRFMYKNPKHRQTFNIASDLIDDGASIELLTRRIEQYSLDQMRVIGDLSANLKTGTGFSYTWVSDELSDSWMQRKIDYVLFNSTCGAFGNSYIRNVENNPWGFLVRRDLNDPERMYLVSLRATQGTKNVQEIAAHFGGGGHMPAAGCKIKALSVEDAVDQVLKFLKQS